MDHFQTIVVGVDFSPYSKIVVKQALALAKGHSAHLVFVNSVNNTSFMAGEVPLLDIEKEIIKPLTHEIITFYKLKDLAPGSKVVVNLGRPANGIIDVAKDFQTPLIVVGHKGKSTPMGRFFLGSSAEQLALHSPFPVWIHRGDSVKIPNKILLPCDYSSRATASLEAAKCLKGSKPKYEFFHVTQHPLPVLDAVQWKMALRAFKLKENTRQRLFHEKFPRVPLVKRAGDPAPLIMKESKKFDLIAMTPHNREGLFSGFGSVTAKVVRAGDTPILITH